MSVPAFAAVCVIYYVVLGIVIDRACDRRDNKATRLAVVVVVLNEVWNLPFFRFRSLRTGSPASAVRARPDPVTLYRAATARAVAVAEAVDATQLDSPTPCSEWTVQQLIDHLSAERNTCSRRSTVGRSPNPVDQDQFCRLPVRCRPGPGSTAAARGDATNVLVAPRL